MTGGEGILFVVLAVLLGIVTILVGVVRLLYRLADRGGRQA